MAGTSRKERKVVTVVFADLVGFTSRAEALDPEDVQAILEPYHARLRHDLERYGGTVEKFIGDAVVAVFGAPVVHEDDAERAVRAALAIRDWAREEQGVEVRIAVNTGEALVSVDARPEAGEGMVAGDVVNTAARLQAAAPVNGILVGEATRRATERAVEYAEAEPVEAKGKAEPVPVWEAVSARSRFGVDLGQTGRVPLVGRARELDLLRGAMARVRDDEALHLVTLVGVPGIGKSRLVRELFEMLEADPELIFWRQGRSLPYGEGVTYWALAEMVKAQAGILESDDAAAAEAKLARAVEAVPDEERAWVEGHLGTLLGRADEDQRGDRAEAFAAWRRFFEAIAETGPLVLVFEDAHWADDGLLDFVDHLVDWATGVPILLVCTARPELLTRRPGWGGGKPNATTVSLTPLSQDETARLVHALLDQAVLPAALQTTLVERAGGNPLYAEEFARVTAERGDAAEVPMPDTIQSLIAARVDALPQAEKEVLEDAAVIGKVFWSGSVCALERRDAVDHALHALERKEFVSRERRSSIAGESQYAFRHSLVRDVAYGQIPRARRAEKHRLAAGWIAALGRPEEHAELLAHHYERALEFQRAAGGDTGELRRQARTAMREAGERAFALNAAAAAARFYAAALDLWPEDDPNRAELLLALGRAYEPIDDAAAVDALRRARTALLAADRPGPAAEADVVLAELVWRHGSGDEARARVEEAAALVAPLSPSRSKALVLSQVARFHMLGSRAEESIATAQRTLSMATELGLDDVRADALATMGAAGIQVGRPDAIAHLEESTELFERLGSVQVLRSYNNLAHSLMEQGDLQRAAEVVERGLATGARFGFEEWLRWLREKQAQTLYITGRWDEGLAATEAALAAIGEGTTHYLQASWREMRASIAVARGERGRALEDCEAALAVARQAEDPQMLQPSLAKRAVVLLDLGDRGGAASLLDELLASLGRHAALRNRYWTEMSEAAVALGRADEALAVLEPVPSVPWVEAARAIAAGREQEAAGILAGIGARAPEADVRRRLAARLLAAGKRAEAEEELERAGAFWRSVVASAYLQEAEALLEVAS